MYHYKDSEDAWQARTYYYLLNLQGTLKGLLNASGTIIVRYGYDSWGKLLSVTDGAGAAVTDPSSAALMNPRSCRGYCCDSETGFYSLQ